MRMIKPPFEDALYSHNDYSVFLAGSIEMGKADEWQLRLAELTTSIPNLVYFNPRRDAWDSSWEQVKENKEFSDQVTWELSHLEEADSSVFYFDPNTKSPVTLLELGLTIGSGGSNIIVCCPNGFWRKGNVDIVCEMYDILQVETLEEVAEEIMQGVLRHDAYNRLTGYNKGRRFDET
jgi:hypothetical protein